ncbi:MAG: ZIP family zinc transporter [Caldimonas sp.]
MPELPTWLAAGLWGILSASGLVVGALAATFGRLSHQTIALMTAFGSGVLVAVLSLELMAGAVERGGLGPAVGGVLGGAALFCGVNWWLSQRGARNRTRCGDCVQQPSEADMPGSGLAIAAGAVIDGIPEALVLGLSVASGQSPSIALVAGFFLGNVPEGLASTSGLQQAKRPARYVYLLWASVIALAGAAAVAGQALAGALSSGAAAVVTAVSSGGLLAMLVETMIPEAFAEAPHFVGLVTAAGFLAAVALIHLG